MADNANLTYSGNANLGQGSNPNISVVSPNANLNILVDTAKNLRNLNFERNFRLFDQKVKDRDTLRELIASGNQVAPVELAPELKAMYDLSEQKVTDSFNKIKGINDQQGIQAFMNAKNDAAEVANHGKLNTIELKKLIQERSDKTLPKDIALYDEHIAKEKEKIKNNYWETVNPLQKPFDFTTEPILKSIKTFTTTIPASEKNPYDTTVTKFDFNGTDNTLKDLYIRDADAAQDMRELLNNFQQLPAGDRTRGIQAMNDQIKKHNEELGLTQGQPGYAEPIKYEPGVGAIQEMPADFAAKYALANQNQFKTQETKFNKDLGAFQINLDKNKIARGNLAVRQGALALANRKFDKMNTDEQAFTQVYDTFLDNATIPTLTGNPLWDVGLTTNATIDANKLPGGAIYGLPDSKGNPVLIKPKGGQYVVRTNAAGEPILGANKQPVTDYVGGTYDIKFVVPKGSSWKGKSVDKNTEIKLSELTNLYNAVRDKKSYTGTYNDFIKQLFNDHVLDTEYEGENGVGNRLSSYVAQQILSNKNTGKGENSPYSQDEQSLLNTELGDQ